MNLQFSNGIWHKSEIIMVLDLLTGFWPVYMYVSLLTPLKTNFITQRPRRSQVIKTSEIKMKVPFLYYSSNIVVGLVMNMIMDKMCS